jgi:hypothetical protein
MFVEEIQIITVMSQESPRVQPCHYEEGLITKGIIGSNRVKNFTFSL